MMRAGIWICLAFLVPACAVQPQKPPGAEVVRAVAKPGVVLPAAQGEVRLVVRSYTVGNTEVKGAECEVESPYHQARATSPAQVLMPAYGANSPVVTVTCSSEGSSGSVSVAPRSGLTGGAGGWPAVGVSVNSDGGVGVGMGWYGGGYGSGTQVVAYPEARVVLQ